MENLDILTTMRYGHQSRFHTIRDAVIIPAFFFSDFFFFNAGRLMINFGICSKADLAMRNAQELTLTINTRPRCSNVPGETHVKSTQILSRIDFISTVQPIFSFYFLMVGSRFFFRNFFFLWCIREAK